MISININSTKITTVEVYFCKYTNVQVKYPVVSEYTKERTDSISLYYY